MEETNVRFQQRSATHVTLDGFQYVQQTLDRYSKCSFQRSDARFETAAHVSSWEQAELTSGSIRQCYLSAHNIT
jgi:hypothetical protein